MAKLFISIALDGAGNTSFACKKEVFKKIHCKWWPCGFPRVSLSYTALRNSHLSNNTLKGHRLRAHLRAS